MLLERLRLSSPRGIPPGPAAGADAHLVKPFRLAQLPAAVAPAAGPPGLEPRE